MKKRWISTAALVLAGLLVLCLFFNNFIKDIPIQLYASEENGLTVTSGDVEMLGTTAGNEETLQVEGVESLPVVEEGSESAVLAEAAQDNVEVLAETTPEDSESLPASIDEYNTLVGNGTKSFVVSTYKQLWSVVDWCEAAGGYEGIAFIIGTPETGLTWDIAGQTDYDFQGIGTQAQPFKGTMYCNYTGGVSLLLDTPLFKYLGDGADVHQLSFVSSDTSAVIAENISGVDVKISDIKLQGTVVNANGAAGIIAANVKDNSSITLSNIQLGTTNDTSGNPVVSTISVTGKIAGGIAGEVGNNVSITLNETVEDGFALGSSGAKIVVTGTEAAGGHFGKVTGACTWDLADETKLYTSVRVSESTGYAGQYAGMLLSSEAAPAKLNITGGNAVTVDVSGAGNGGGFVGFCGNATPNSVTITRDTTDTFTVTGTINMTDESGTAGNYAGGLIGELTGATLDLSNYVINAQVVGKTVGGVAGRINSGNYILGNITVNGAVGNDSVTSVAGGLVGDVTNTIFNTAVELQGAIKVTSLANASHRGWIAGTQHASLIYYSEVEGKLSDGTAQFIGADTSIEEIGTYGGVYRNQQLAENKKLIGDGNLANVGVINNTITKSGDNYQLTSVSDFETLAIALGTIGNFGTEAFGVISDETLLASSYVVTSSVDISYDKTGIIALNRNDTEDGRYAFSGSMQGADEENPCTITQNSSVRQERVGLFSTISGNVSFSNLIVGGTVTNALGAGGIAYQSIGTGLNLDNIAMKKTFTGITTVLSDKTELYVGGVLALENGSGDFQVTATDITLASVLDATVAYAEKNYSGFITKSNNADIIMDEVVLGGSFTSRYIITNGGFLGETWENVGGKISNVTVQDGTTYMASGNFGCMVTNVTTALNKRLTFDTMKLAGLSVSDNGSELGNNALLVHDARAAIIEVIDYDTTECTVNISNNSFDEVVGKTVSSGPLDSNQGIVSIHSRTAMFPEYYYQNQATYTTKYKGTNNQFTRYFYDVFQWLETEEEDGTITKFQFDDDIIDSPAKALLWDVVHYANGYNNNGNVRKTFSQYFGEGNTWGSEGVGNWENYTFANEEGKNCLDLSQISFYPVIDVGAYFTGKDNVVIKFDAKEMAEAGIPSSAWGGRHYGLQAGLLSNTSTVYISNLTLTGTITNIGFRTGALVGGNGGVSGTGSTFTNITLQDLWVYGYDSTAEEKRIGLMVSKVPRSSVTFNGIKMEGYPEDSETKAAAALIGEAGGTNVTNLVLNFRSMVIADDKDGLDTFHNGDVLAYASFIYQYNYTDDATINEGYGLYLFTDTDDASGNVTYGEELDFETEYSNNSNTVFEEGVDADPATLYKPYVYTTKQIEVNPKSGDILKGCGTYEDPYIIETAKQFLTLYRYMNDKKDSATNKYQFQTFYEGWQVIKTGDDTKFCSKHRVTESETGTLSGDGVSDVKTFGDVGFPTPEDMSRAYYQLGADIDLSVLGSGTYGLIAKEFVGFGTQDCPFVGVWYGKDAEGNIHTITLPDKEVTRTYDTYGFIQYAKGAVVKDMIIKTSEDVETDGSESETEGETTTEDTITESTTAASVRAQIRGMGGGVIACILGGDNIIDNVTVAVEYKVADENAVIGGYVGNVQKGGLILRGVSEGVAATEGTPAKPGSLSGFSLDQAPNQKIITDEKGNYKIVYEHLGAVVGKVEDGYVVYEGSTDVTSVLWSLKGGNTSYEQVPNYNILNARRLEAQCQGLTVAIDGGNITSTIPTAEALQVMSMALNADALNVRPSDYASYKGCGYTENSRSRKAKYSDIGCTDATTTDYVNAAKYDNVMSYNQDGYTKADTAYAFPYLYQYMGITADTYDKFIVDVSGDVYSVINTRMAINSTNYIHQWNLVDNGTYDMSVFGNSFRGLGALYGTGVEYGGVFYGDFDGKNSTITLDMNRKLLGADKTNTSVAKAGLFNVLYPRDAALYKASGDFRDIDATEAVNKLGAEIKNFVLTGKITADANKTSNRFDLGGIAAQIYKGTSCFIFSNISINNFKAYSYIGTNSDVNNVGGIVGFIDDDAYVLIENCNVQGTDTNKVELRGAIGWVNNGYGAGGLVGKINKVYLKILTSNVEHAVVQAGRGDYAGGFIANISSNSAYFICEGAESNPCSVKFTEIGNHSSESGGINQVTGGFVGGANCPINMKYVSAENLTMRAYDYVGGVVGYLGNNNSSKIAHASIKNIVASGSNLYDGSISGIGGIVGGNCHILTIEDADVFGEMSNEQYKSTLKAYNNMVRTNSIGVGGIIGSHLERTLTLTNCSVDSILMSTDQHSNNTYALGAGGIAGILRAPIVLTGEITTSNLNVIAPLRSEAAGAVMAAGGCFGYVNGTGVATQNGTITGLTDSMYYDGLNASGNTIKGKQAGGVIGYVSSNQTDIRLTGLSVSGGTVTSDEAAGGVFGYTYASSNGIALHNYATNNISNMDISGRIAGGIIGDMHMYGPMRLEGIVLEGNSITGLQKVTAANYSAGGVIGSCWGDVNSYEYDITTRMFDIKLTNNEIVCETTTQTLSANEKDYPAVGGLIGRIADNQTGKVADILCDNFMLCDDNEIGLRQKNTTDIKLVCETESGYQLADVSLPTTEGITKDYEVLQQLTNSYGYYVGNMVGVVQGESVQLYMLRSKDTNNKFVVPVMKGENVNPPVTDAGRTSGQTVDEYRKYCHIVYGATVSEAKVAASNLTDMQNEVARLTSGYEATDTLPNILQEYRLSKKHIDVFNDVYKGDGYTFSVGKKIDFPILVWKAEYGTIQEVMEAITDVMTNVAGASAADIDERYLKIKCQQKLYTPAVLDDAGNVISKAVIENGTGTASIVAETVDGVTTFKTLSSQYDGLVEDKLSYTEITYNYSWAGRTKTFVLPIFVEEPILYGVHSKMIEGKVADVETVKTQGISEPGKDEQGNEKTIIMANDSDYTMLLEYTYSKARKNMPDHTYVDKVFYLTDPDAAKQVAVGTKLMLIDVTNGNKVYYYTVENSGVMQIKFTDFKDSSGNPYVNQSINKLESVVDAGMTLEDGYYTDLDGHSLTDTAVESFLLTVLVPDNAADVQEGYAINAGIQIADAGLASRFDTLEGHAERTRFVVKSIPGIAIQFTEDATTDISGSISKEEDLTVKAGIEIRAKGIGAIYWDEKGKGSEVIDSANNGKFLDVAFFLRDLNNNRVNLPTGTNFSYKIADGQSSENKVVANNSVMYYYKDIREVFGKENSEYVIKDITKNTTVYLEFYLDFSGADFSNISEAKYKAWLELLRTSNRDYPTGSNNKVDDYSAEVDASATQQMGFSVKATDLYQLAINTYQLDEPTNIINFNVMFDFSDILSQTTGNGANKLVEKWTGYNYTVTYQIYQKTLNGDVVDYLPYKGDDIEIIIEGAKATNVVTNSDRSEVVTALYQFTEEDFTEADSEENKGLITLPGKLTIQTKDLANDRTALTNYKLKATLTIMEQSQEQTTTTQPVETTEDFFIYTITKLKTDI